MVVNWNFEFEGPVKEHSPLNQQTIKNEIKVDFVEEGHQSVCDFVLEWAKIIKDSK